MAPIVRAVSAVAWSMALVGFIAGWLAGRASRTAADHAASVAATRTLGKQVFQHRLVAIAVIVVVIGVIRAFMVEDGYKDKGPKPTPSPTIQPASK